MAIARVATTTTTTTTMGESGAGRIARNGVVHN
jgi:hypothetical protein